MKLKIHIAALGLLLADAPGYADPPGELTITGFKRVGSQATLQWTGGRANYQVQTRADLNSAWTDLGSPTASLSGCS